MIAAGHEQAPALAGATVLIVEDEAVVALNLALMLRELGCIALGPAVDNAQALALLRRQRPDAVLLDLGLLDGFAGLWRKLGDDGLRRAAYRGG
jgi:CheY-like chemotaxis protein